MESQIGVVRFGGPMSVLDVGVNLIALDTVKLEASLLEIEEI